MKKRITSITIFILVITSIFSQESLYPVKKWIKPGSNTGLIGYIDYSGNLIIPHQFSWGTAFENGFATVKNGGQYQIIDTENHILYDCDYDEMSRFSCGLCAVKKQSEKYGYINSANEVIIPFIYDYAEDFIKGYAVVGINRKRGLIDCTGNICIPIEYDSLSFETNSIYEAKKNNQIIYLYTDGSKILTDDELYPKDDSYIIYKDRDKELYGLKNGEGIILLPPQYTFLSLPNNNNLCLFSVNEEGYPEYGLITVTGEIVYPSDTFYLPDLSKFNENEMTVFSAITRDAGWLRDDGVIFFFRDIAGM